MKLKLTRPIVFFDLETTGLNIGRDHIVEISVVKIYPDGKRDSYTRRVNPGMHIPAEATAVHHITDEDVQGQPFFKDIAPKLAKYIEGCDLGGYNSNKFDIPMLAEEFLNAGVTEVDLHRANFVDVQNIFHKKEQRTLSAAYKFYCDKDLEGAHAASADIQATVEVFEAQLEKYDDLPQDVKGLAEYTAMTRNVDLAGRFVYDNNNVVVFSFGKYKGFPVAEILRKEPSYYDWMMNGDFTQETKRVLTQIKISLGNVSKKPGK